MMGMLPAWKLSSDQIQKPCFLFRMALLLLCGVSLLVLGCDKPTTPPTFRLPPQKELVPALKRPTARALKKQHVRISPPNVRANLQEVAAAKEDRHLEIYHMVVRDALAYACTIVQGFQIYDVKNPQLPRDIGELRFPLPYGAYGKPGCRFVAIDGTTAYVTDSVNALQPKSFLVAIDVANPKAPVALAYYSNPNLDLQQVVAQNGWVYVASLQEGLVAFKLESKKAKDAKPSSKPTKQRVAQVRLPPSSKPVVLSQVRESKPTSRPVKSRKVVASATTRATRSRSLAALQKTIAFSSRLAEGTPRTSRTPKSLSLRAQLRGFQNAQGLALWGRYLLVADGMGGLKVVDLQKPGTPRIVGHHKTKGFARRVAVWGRHVYVAEGSAGFEVFSLHDPSHPRLVASIPTTYSVMQIELSHHYAFVANWNDLQVYDVRNPRRPKLVARRALKKRPDTFRLPHETSLSRIRNATLALKYPYIVLGEWQGLRTVRFRPHKAPILKLSHSALRWGAKKARRTLTITNQGQVPLVLSRVRSRSRSFVPSVSELWIPPHQSRRLHVQYDPRKGRERGSTLTFETNDPHHRKGSISLLTQPVSSGQLHTSFALIDIFGRRHRLADLRGKVVLLSYFATF